MQRKKAYEDLPGTFVLDAERVMIGRHQPRLVFQRCATLTFCAKRVRKALKWSCGTS